MGCTPELAGGLFRFCLADKLFQPKDPRLVMVSPEIDNATSELAAIITDNSLRRATFKLDFLNGRHHILTPRSLAHGNGKTLSYKQADNRQHPEPLSRLLLISHKVHHPGLIGSRKLTSLPEISP